MPRQSDLASRPGNADLKGLLHSLARKIDRSRDRKIGEQNTKATLVEPILEALGWDIRNWEEVHREYRAKSSDSPVDYALKIMRTPRLFLEAKGLGGDLADRKWVGQVLGYATVAGVEWCVLTDGDEWRFYNSTAAIDADEKLFCKVRISDGELDHAVEILSLLARSNIEGNLLDPLWAAHFVDRRVKGALCQMLETRDAALVRLICRKASKLRPRQIVESLGRLDVQIGLPTVRPAVAPPAQPGLAELIAAGVLKAGARLFGPYKGQTFEANLLPDGAIEFQGQRYATPSAAGAAARATLAGKMMSTNGWGFWRVEGNDGNPRTLSQVRDEYLKR